MSRVATTIACIVVASATALQVPRRRALAALAPGAAASLVLAPGGARAAWPFDGESDEEKAKKLQAALKAPPADPSLRACGSRFVGTYTDPKHPGCTRRVAQIGGTKFASIYGADEDGKPWVVKATVACAGYNGVEAEQLIVDFTPKGGPSEAVALAAYEGFRATLTFPDGNVWTMVPCSNPNLKTKQQIAACRAGAKA